LKRRKTQIKQNPGKGAPGVPGSDGGQLREVTLKQLNPISEPPEPIARQRKGLNIPIDPTQATCRPALEQEGFGVPPSPDSRIKVATTRPWPQDGHRLLKQDWDVPAPDR
jgi:hypothetical protein